jgi:hypothetical protein
MRISYTSSAKYHPSSRDNFKKYYLFISFAFAYLIEKYPIDEKTQLRIRNIRIEFMDIGIMKTK